MDAPRRWQIASLATAVGGLGVGAMLVDRSTTEPVAPIVLELAHDVSDPGEAFRFPEPSLRPEIVTADVVSGTTPISGVSADDPDDGVETAGTSQADTSRPPTPTPAPTPESGPSSPEAAEASVEDADESADSPDEVDADDSVDSVDSD